MYKIYSQKTFEYQTKLEATQHNIAFQEEQKNEENGKQKPILNHMENKVMGEFNNISSNGDSFGDYKKD